MEDLQLINDTFKDEVAAIHSLVASIHTYEEKLANIDMDQKLAYESIATIFTSILDKFIGIFNNFSTTLLKFRKLVKRSELKYYLDSNTTTVKVLNRTDYTKVAKLEIPTITGMKVTYPQFADRLEKTLKSIDIVSKLREILKISKFMNKELMNDEPSLSKLNKQFMDVFSKDYFKELRVTISKIIDLDEKKVIETPFGEQFGSMRVFKEVVDQALSMTFIYDDVDKSRKIIDDIHNHFDDMIELLELNKIKIEKKDIRGLSDSAMLLGEALELFGNITIIYNKLEHNLVDVYKVLKKEL